MTEEQPQTFAVMAEDQPQGAPRVCEFYLLPRGCVKGDKCDFAHPAAPCGKVTNKVCEYFLKPRGCIKGDQCDFIHPAGMNPKSQMGQQMGQGQNGKGVCKYFQSPRGCIKGDTCDFMHPTMMGGMQGGMPGGMGGMGGMRAADSGKPCEFFMTPRGCIKGNNCDFAHLNPMMQQSQMYGMGMGMGYQGMAQQGGPMISGGPMQGNRLAMTPMGPMNSAGKLMKPKLCDFFNTEKGCVKGDMCEFVHQKQKPCEFFASPRGCRKGKFCDFLHEGAAGDVEANAAGKVTKAATTAPRYAPY